jgi:hypothetical protein
MHEKKNSKINPSNKQQLTSSLSLIAIANKMSKTRQETLVEGEKKHQN